MDLHEEAGKENEQTVANLSPAEEATKKERPVLDDFSKQTFSQTSLHS